MGGSHTRRRSAAAGRDDDGAGARGAQGTQGPAGANATSLWAVVGGTYRPLVSSTDVHFVTKQGTGQYEVALYSVMYKCSREATLYRLTGTRATGSIVTALDTPVSANTRVVHPDDTTWAVADLSFSVAVFCSRRRESTRRPPRPPAVSRTL